MRREFTWHTASGKRVRVLFLRLLSMQTREIACQQIRLMALDTPVEVDLTLGLDFSPLHRTFGQTSGTVRTQVKRRCLA
uniref:CAZy families GH65 protein n=1 Tax=uncultured Caldicellulosiruptor sp. TaxID=569407 RepID=A0A060CIG4_9FIRM|nr:CAZy families GH65 protein [uncultured Caldicellulosiruptor sp.]